MTIEYTQHSVAFPTLSLSQDWHTDEVYVHYSDDDPRRGEFHWTFMRFGGGKSGVRMEVFGDGLPCLFDPAVVRVVAGWAGLPDPDAILPRDLIALLESVGAQPSSYHKAGCDAHD